jgi:hypothetical protein
LHMVQSPTAGMVRRGKNIWDMERAFFNVCVWCLQPLWFASTARNMVNILFFMLQWFDWQKFLSAVLLHIYCLLSVNLLSESSFV